MKGFERLEFIVDHVPEDALSSLLQSMAKGVEQGNGIVFRNREMRDLRLHINTVLSAMAMVRGTSKAQGDPNQLIAYAMKNHLYQAYMDYIGALAHIEEHIEDNGGTLLFVRGGLLAQEEQVAFSNEDDREAFDAVINYVGLLPEDVFGYFVGYGCKPF